MTSNYRAGANYGTIPDCDPFQNHCTSTDPNAASDPDGTTDKRLFGYGVHRLDPVVMVRDVAQWADKAVASHLNAFRCVEHGKPVYVSATANHQSRGGASQTSRQQHDVII
jgi:hypothetical protein